MRSIGGTIAEISTIQTLPSDFRPLHLVELRATFRIAERASDPPIYGDVGGREERPFDSQEVIPQTPRCA